MSGWKQVQLDASGEFATLEQQLTAAWGAMARSALIGKAIAELRAALEAERGPDKALIRHWTSLYGMHQQQREIVLAKVHLTEQTEADIKAIGDLLAGRGDTVQRSKSGYNRRWVNYIALKWATDRLTQ
jgi:hypothetical protein